MNYLRFEPAGTSDSGKTKRWTVKNLGETILGYVSWCGPWRKYVYHTGSVSVNLIFEWECLRQIATFCEDRTREHKA